MFLRNSAATPFPIPLSLDSGQRILSPQGEGVLGWMGGGKEGAAEQLAIPGSLLEPCPTASIIYACNLPAALVDGPLGVLDVSGRLPSKIGRDLEDDFLAGSFPGGQAAIIAAGGERTAVHFRWACLTAHVSIGAVWRCFARVGSRSNGACWRAIEHDYIFEAGGGIVLNPPGAAMIPSADELTSTTLHHPDGMLTSFPCNSGRVKVTRLSPDGWARRHILGIMLHDDNRIVAFFSDGKQEAIAIAAPSSKHAARAA